MPRVANRDGFKRVTINGQAMLLVNLKFVPPDYDSDRQFVVYGNVIDDKFVPDPASGISETAASLMSPKEWRDHLEAHRKGTCPCGATLEGVESLTPLDGRTMLISEECLE